MVERIRAHKKRGNGKETGTKGEKEQEHIKRVEREHKHIRQAERKQEHIMKVESKQEQIKVEVRRKQDKRRVKGEETGT